LLGLLQLLLGLLELLSELLRLRVLLLGRSLLLGRLLGRARGGGLRQRRSGYQYWTENEQAGVSAK
jgi:hypothetical protein